MKLTSFALLVLFLISFASGSVFLDKMNTLLKTYNFDNMKKLFVW